MIMLSPTNTEHLTDTLTVSPTYTSSPTELPQPNDDVTITPTLTLSPIETLDPSLSEKPGQDFLRDCVSSTLWMPFEANQVRKVDVGLWVALEYSLEMEICRLSRKSISPVWPCRLVFIRMFRPTLISNLTL